MGGRFGGRALKRSFQNEVTDRVSERLLRHPESAVGFWKLDLDEAGKPLWTSATEQPSTESVEEEDEDLF